MTSPILFAEERKGFHLSLLNSILSVDSSGIPSNADKDSDISREIAASIYHQIQDTLPKASPRLAGQTSGKQFEEHSRTFLERTFLKLAHLRPGHWRVERCGGRGKKEISGYAQYAHLSILDECIRKTKELAASLGNEYIISPDIVILREPEEDSEINRGESLVDHSVCLFSSLRKKNNPLPLLHASLSCKWTLRSDRAQNARSEALNLLRNRKGRAPHLVVITAEPLPSRIASLALGTGDLDCVYHFALDELRLACEQTRHKDALEMLRIMIEGGRLRDIADLPLDLAV